MEEGMAIESVIVAVKLVLKLEAAAAFADNLFGFSLKVDEFCCFCNDLGVSDDLAAAAATERLNLAGAFGVLKPSSSFCCAL